MINARIRTILTTIVILLLCRAAASLAGGYFRLTLTDGTVMEGEMIRVTPSTIEIDPDGPDTLAVVNRGLIADIVYTKFRPGKTSAGEIEAKRSETGRLAMRFDCEIVESPEPDRRPVYDYIMIDSLLYNTGRFEDFMIELPTGWNSIRFCGIRTACFELRDFFNIEEGGSGAAIWRGIGDGFHASNIVSVDIRPDSVTLVSYNRRNGIYIMIDDESSGVFGYNEFGGYRGIDFKQLDLSDGIVPGRLVYGRVPGAYQYHDSLEYRYSVIGDELRSGHFGDILYLPGVYTIETRAAAFNKWRYAAVDVKTDRYDIEIRSGRTTRIEFEPKIDSLACKISISPDSSIKISAREAGE